MKKSLCLLVSVACLFIASGCSSISHGGGGGGGRLQPPVKHDVVVQKGLILPSVFGVRWAVEDDGNALHVYLQKPSDINIEDPVLTDNDIQYKLTRKNGDQAFIRSGPLKFSGSRIVTTEGVSADRMDQLEKTYPSERR